MNRLEFLTALRNTLEKGGLSSGDINDALSYYEEVFLDAGVSKEEETAASLGDPTEIAKGILADSGISVAPENTSYTNTNTVRSESTTSGATGLKIAIFILLFPVWFPIFATVSAILFALMVAAVSLVAAFAGAGVALLFESIPTLFRVPPAGVFMFGAGLFITGLFLGFAKMCFKNILPSLGRGIKAAARFITRPFRKGDANNG